MNYQTSPDIYLRVKEFNMREIIYAYLKVDIEFNVQKRQADPAKRNLGHELNNYHEIFMEKA